MAERCLRLTKNGTPCRGRVWRDGLCRFHHPDTEAERAEARRKGGAGKSHAARAERRMVTYTIGGVRAILSTVLRDLLEGRIETGVATAAATLGRAVITANEKGEMEARIAELERRAGVVPEAGQD